MAERLIGLTGFAGAGKDTVALLFERLAGYKPYAFAKPLKQALDVLGIREPADRAQKEALIPGRNYSYRTAAQRLGTEWARSLDPDFWINLATDFVQKNDRVVISDVRFENEANMVRSKGGTMIHIVGREPTVTGENLKHPSEKQLIVQVDDIVLDNSGDLHALHYKVLEILHMQDSNQLRKVGNSAPSI